MLVKVLFEEVKLQYPHYTLTMCVNAKGEVVRPSQLLYKGNSLKKEFEEESCGEVLYINGSKKGWQSDVSKPILGKCFSKLFEENDSVLDHLSKQCEPDYIKKTVLAVHPEEGRPDPTDDPNFRCGCSSGN
eukprot:TRINITY_DN2520_c0_g1_i4.p3 TRINITY_DN2520_c0_g1~~TRINITY_DN2520_c0_g1_i4.p3  ORF type:complete len:131 (+),score=21.88 TRINITY_DN2520_c0_g1_i4:392-784(+)